LEGWVVKPLDFEEGRRYPLIVDLHGGPSGGIMQEFNPEWHWLAAHGYLVFAADFRGSQLYGRFDPPTEPADQKDVLAGIEALVKRGDADPQRMGLRGHSYGAGLAAWLGGSGRFQAIVMTGFVGYAEEDSSESSPLEGYRGSTLILQGEHDDASSPETLVRNLRSLGIEAVCRVFPGEGHLISEPENRRDLLSQMLEWFNRHLPD
jgi:dipeptidyl aminopeptidase/acylaminoacyl peptidase